MEKESILSVTHNKKEILKCIIENMIKLRPKGKIELRPYLNPENIVSKKYAGGYMTVDLKELFPNSRKGDFAYFRTNIYTNENHTAAVCLKGNACAYYKNECIIEASEDEMKFADVEVGAGENELIIKVYCSQNSFKFDLAISPPPFPGMWSNDYLMWNRAASPLKEFRGEDGFTVSPLFKADDENTYSSEDFIYPPLEKDDSIIDLTKLYGAHNGKYALALSHCVKEGALKIIGDENNTVYVNDLPSQGECMLKPGDKIIVVSKCEGSNWGFESLNNDILGLPFINTQRKYAHWAILGYFDNDKCRKDISFDKTYVNSDNEKTFWRLAQEHTYLRPYLDTCFFGQWYYALMVGHYGILNASEFMGEEYLDYFKESIAVLAKYYDYMQYEKEIFEEPAFLGKSWYLDNLDSIGSMGMNLCELYKLTKDKNAMNVLNVLTQSAMENIPRFPDGTFYRHPIKWCDGSQKHIMWADDTYMSCPFFVRFGEITGDEKYYYEAANQLKGFYKRLFMKDKKLMSHVYFVDDNEMGGVAWGRGNGWVFYTIADVLEHLPDNFELKKDLLLIYNEFLEGIAENIDEEGMWHQVMDCPESYRETSCTAMFIAGIAKGIRNKWIQKEKYMPLIEKAWTGLAKTAIDKNGCIYGVCKGSGCHREKEYYMNLGTVINDDHGTGIVMTALCELINLEREEEI